MKLLLLTNHSVMQRVPSEYQHWILEIEKNERRREYCCQDNLKAMNLYPLNSCAAAGL